MNAPTTPTFMERGRMILATCRSVRANGCYTQRMTQAVVYANGQGWQTEAELLALVMSFLLLDAAQLASGMRWNGVWP